MLVCQCRGVTDRQIRRLVRDGAHSTREIVRATGVGRDCGGCRSNVKKVVELAIEQVAQREFQTTVIHSHSQPDPDPDTDQRRYGHDLR